MRNNIVATYSHTDREVRSLVRSTFALAFLGGIAVGAFLLQAYRLG